MEKYDFSGWATRNDLLCGDGRTIRKNAFKDNDGVTVPLIWNHEHNDPNAVLGHALLENRDSGVYAYGVFNDTEQGQHAKALVQNGDVRSLSIWANKLKQIGNDVVHGNIRELSLVLAGANPGAYIDFAIAHSEDEGESFIASYDENIVIYHSAEPKEEPKKEEKMAEVKEPLVHAEGENSEETIGDILNTLSEKQMDAVAAAIAMVMEDGDDEDEEDDMEHSEGGEFMKHNVFDTEEMVNDNYLSHADEMEIVNLAKNKSVGTLQNAIEIYAKENDHLAHGIDEIETLFPEYKDVYPGAPELLTRDQGWVGVVMQKVHKSPISRIRTRQADARSEELNALGYVKGNKKKNGANIKLLKRTTDPQTVYRKDFLHRDDIIDITDFDVVEYQYQIMKMNLNEEIAKAIMIGDGREEGSEDKISEEHIRPIWTDDELYTIHYDVDIAGARAELQGTNTSANFSENYIYAEAIIKAALYSREKYKGSGSLDFYCTPHLLNVMLLARDLNGRRIYDSKSDLTAALNVGNIYTCEQFEGKTRTTTDSKTKKLLGLFVNLSDYQVGSTKGGEITRFNQFDIDFNQEKYLIETRLSGALTRVFSAIALEEDVTA